MAITNIFGDDEQPMPSVAYSGVDGEIPPAAGIARGFANCSSFDVPPQVADQAPIDRHIVPARTESGSGGPHSSDAGDRFSSGPARHVI
jgi:hypothetical protein